MLVGCFDLKTLQKELILGLFSYVAIDRSAYIRNIQNLWQLSTSHTWNGLRKLYGKHSTEIAGS